jgi:hypothetical protein
LDDRATHIDESESFVRSQVRRANRNLLIWNLMILAALAVLAWFTRVYYYNFFFGPFPADDGALLDYAREPGHGELLRYLDLGQRQLLPSGFVEVSTRNDQPYSRIPYFLTRVGGDRYLVVQAERADDGRHLVGPLYRVPDDVRREVIDRVVQRQPALRDHVLPVMFNNAAAFRVAGYIGLAVFVPLGLLSLVNLGRAAVRVVNPTAHPAARDQDRAEAIDEEVSAGPAERFGRATLTRSWVVWPTAFGMKAVRLKDAVWVYPVVVGGRHAVVLQLRNRKSAVVSLKAPAVQPLLKAILARVPWVLAGYDKQRYLTWRKRPDEVIAEAEERRESYRQRGRPGTGRTSS